MIYILVLRLGMSRRQIHFSTFAPGTKDQQQCQKWCHKNGSQQTNRSYDNRRHDNVQQGEEFVLEKNKNKRII